MTTRKALSIVAVVLCLLAAAVPARATICNDNDIFVPVNFGLPHEDQVCSPTTTDVIPIDGQASCASAAACERYAINFCYGNANCMLHGNYGSQSVYYSLHVCSIVCYDLADNVCDSDSNQCW